MALVNHSVTNLINGVSQQSPAIRLDNQLEEQINCFSDVTKGLTIRNGLELTSVTNLDLGEHSNIIEFTMDGEKYVLNLNPEDLISPLTSIPISADIATLDASATDLKYFDGVRKGDLRILEDKDKVYVLNTSRTVSEVSLGSAYVDFWFVDSNTNEINDLWTGGDYQLDFRSVQEVTPPVIPTATTSTGVITRATTLTDIADAINSDVNFVAEAGLCIVTGSPSNFRVTWFEIPVDFVAPQLVSTSYPTEQPHRFVNTLTESSAPAFSASNNVARPDNDTAWNQQWTFGGVVLGWGNANNWSFHQGGYIYYKSAKQRTGLYKITRVRYEDLKFEYRLGFQASTIQPASVALDVPTEGMIWVTGVSSNQTYEGTIKYYHTSAPLTELTLPITTISVGTSPANIRLNYVSGEINTQINASSDLTSTPFDNAVYIKANSDYVISSIEVTNNFDNTSINGVPSASIENLAGILDISTLPSIFAEGFKVRVGNPDSPDSSYYLSYSVDFRGWREAGLDSQRFLDPLTMPQVIDKDKIRTTGVITLEPEDWVRARAGDSKSNKSPSFVSKNIKDIFSYGSRLGFATDDTIVMSAINDTDTFYRTTASRTVTSDRVDIKLDSSKTGFDTIKHVTIYNQKLFINTGSSQSTLLVNNSFDLTTARLTEVSSYSLGDKSPLPVENGLYFSITDNDFTGILNYTATSDSTSAVNDLTKHCPTYIEGTVKRMVYSKNITAISMNEDRRTLYMQNRFGASEILQNAWHKWELPYDIEYIYFHQGKLNVLMTTKVGMDTFLIVGTYDIKTEDVIPVEELSTNRINWLPYLDLYTRDKTLIENFPDFIGVNTQTGVKFATVTEAFDSTQLDQLELNNFTTETFEKDISPNFYWLVEGDLNTIVFNDGTPIQFGNNTTTVYDDGGFRYFKGADQSNGYFGVYRADRTVIPFTDEEMIYGLKFKATMVLSKVIPRNNSTQPPTVMTYAKLMLRRMRLFLTKTGDFVVKIKFKGRKDFEIASNRASVGSLNIGIGEADDATYNFPINGQSDLVTISIETDSSTPFNLLATEWQGQLITRGRNI